MSSAQLGTNEFNEDDKLSIGNYTGLENSLIIDELKIDQKEKNIKCTCNCKCDICSNVKILLQEKEIGFLSDFDSILNFKNQIYVRDLKQHNLDLNYHDSLLGGQELMRVLPDSKLVIGIVTFNMAGKHCHSSLNDLLFPDSMIIFPDLYVIGIQEAFSREPNELKEWSIELQATIGPSHVLLYTASLGVLHLSIFIRRELVWFCSAPEEDSQLCKLNPPSNLIRTKGATGVSFSVFGTTFLFINSHFPAHQNKLIERVEEYTRMINGLDLPISLKPLLKPRYLSKDITNRFDCVFWFGDLNFRIDQDQETVLNKIETIKKNQDNCYKSILEFDQLTLSMIKEETFSQFQESQINFQPTYKYIINSNSYDEKSTRVPSYTDRILFKSKRKGHIECKVYNSVQSIKTSDHKPVFGLFQCQIRPGVDDCPLNGGIFHNDVYIEALKRRQQAHSAMPEMPRNKGLIANLKARKWFDNSY